MPNPLPSLLLLCLGSNWKLVVRFEIGDDAVIASIIEGFLYSRNCTKNAGCIIPSYPHKSPVSYVVSLYTEEETEAHKY